LIAPLSGCSAPVISLNRVGLAGAVRADHADDAARRQREAQIVEQQFVAIGLDSILDVDDVAAEPLGHLDQISGLAGRAFSWRLTSSVEGAEAGLGLGLAGLGERRIHSSSSLIAFCLPCSSRSSCSCL
jgi:hypothetical protein